MLSRLDIALFEAANQLAGRSFTLDALMALAMEDPLAKGGVLAACFLFAWWHRSGDGDAEKRRATLLLTLGAVFLVAPVMKLVSSEGPLRPRPLEQAGQMVVFEDGVLRELPKVAYRAPQTGLAADLSADESDGTVAANDLASFPSDHAALFLAFAGGIFVALRSAGLVALGWTVFCILLPRVVTGLHWPSDMLAGGAAGLAILALVIFAGRKVFAKPVATAVALAERYRPWAQALLFLALAEVASAMSTLQRTVELLAGIAGR